MTNCLCFDFGHNPKSIISSKFLVHKQWQMLNIRNFGLSRSDFHNQSTTLTIFKRWRSSLHEDICAVVTTRNILMILFILKQIFLFLFAKYKWLFRWLTQQFLSNIIWSWRKCHQIKLKMKYNCRVILK